MRNRLTSAILCLAFVGTAPLRAEERRPVRFAAPAGYHLLKCDFHMHTVFSDGRVWPTVRVDEAWREGLDAIAISDHLEVQPFRQYVPTSRNAPQDLAAGRASERNIILIRGAEITRPSPPGHHNAIFLWEIAPLDTKDYRDAFVAARQQNAFVFWNHPGRQGTGSSRWGEAQEELLRQKQLHGVEICNGQSYYEDAHRWAMERKLTLIGNSDAHEPTWGMAWTPARHRTLTLVFGRERTAEGIREALDAGRTVVWFQNQLIGYERNLLPVFDACVRISPVHHRTRDAAWFQIHNESELDLELERLDQGAPPKILVASGLTALVKVPTPNGVMPPTLPCRAANFVVAPGQTLAVNLRIVEAAPSANAAP